MNFRPIVRIITVLLCLAVGSWSQNVCADKPQIMVLGTYHMANPGHDIYDVHADDVRSPKRQQELAQLTDVLAQYQPTKIAIEADPDSKKVPAAFQDYLAGKHELSRNEIEQIGFRLAKRLGQKELYPVDVDGEFPWQRVVNYAKAKGRSAELDKMLSSVGQDVAKEDAYLKSHTVLEFLLYLNLPSSVAAGNDFYMQLVSFGEPGDYAGPDLLRDWYVRNIRIHSNILKLITSPSDRILVIYGSGHLGWLQGNVKMDSHLCLRTLAEFAPNK
jgi:Family of unknown function (DUF5694)